MKLLLDTHALLWLLQGDEQLSLPARRAIADPTQAVACSVVSAWEIAIKASLGRLDVPEPLEPWLQQRLRDARIDLWPVQLRHAAGVRSLPWHHKDPFDRLLAATALAEAATLVSVDAVFDRYGVARLW